MSLSRATSVTISFPLIDNASRPARKTGATGFTSMVSKDGGAFAATTNSASEIATASGRYKLLLTAAEMNASIVHVYVTATGCDPVDLPFQTYGLASGSVTGTSTTTSIVDSSQTSTVTDFWKGAFIRFTSGALAGQVRQVTGYATNTFTCSAFTSAPSTGDFYVIVNG